MLSSFELEKDHGTSNYYSFELHFFGEYGVLPFCA